MTSTELRRLRQRLGWTQRALAERLGVTETTVIRWENEWSRITPPMARLIRFVAQANESAPRPSRAPKGRPR